jgi:hypothetical protein
LFENLQKQKERQMKNVLLWIGTTVFYFALLCAVGGPMVSSHLGLTLLIVALLCAPFNINGNIFTILGNAESEKNIFSIFSLYQRADRGAYNILGLSLYQRAGRDAYSSFGLSLYQRADEDAVNFLGLSIYQRAGRDAYSIGLSLYQRADGDAYGFLSFCWREERTKMRW